MEDNHLSVQGRDSAGISYCYKNMGLDEFGSVEILNLKERITFEYSIRDGILIQIKSLDPWKILLDYANGSFYIYDDNKTKYKNLLENLDRASIVDNYDELEEMIFLYCVEAYGISRSKRKFCQSPELRKISFEQNRCAMACQGCGAVLFLLKSSGITFHNPLLLSYHTKQLN